jgi:hypothetical protein
VSVGAVACAASSASAASCALFFASLHCVRKWHWSWASHADVSQGKGYHTRECKPPQNEQKTSRAPVRSWHAYLASLNARRLASRSASAAALALFLLACCASYWRRCGHFVPGGKSRSHVSNATNICLNFSSASSVSHCEWFLCIELWSSPSRDLSYLQLQPMQAAAR